ncbi:MAG: hypothetical protein U9R01_07875, partial [candidate division WOR-3 bacterium]|nr:hypothetical protein [candidate division WOR-3 bacterium]
MPEERTDLGNAQGDQGQQGDSGDQGNQNQQGQQGDQGNQGQQGTQEFEIPEEHREKGWAKKVKSREDVFKQL